MYGSKKVHGKYPGNLHPGKYSGMNAPGYVRSIDNGMENPKNNLAHRFWPEPDFSIKKIQF